MAQERSTHTQAFLPGKAKVVDGVSVREALDREGSNFF